MTAEDGNKDRKLKTVYNVNKRGSRIAFPAPDEDDDDSDYEIDFQDW
jgi:hypothetical protein